MRNQSLLIIFFFCLFFQNAYSIIPMTKRNELPMIKINGNKKNVNINKQTYKIGNDRYFLFDLKDLFEASNGNYEDFLFFTINLNKAKIRMLEEDNNKKRTLRAILNNDTITKDIVQYQVDNEITSILLLI